MCGIAGIIASSSSHASLQLDATAAAMAGALQHRGPDASGTWTDEQRGVSLAHSRLSILDLSAHGRQPMVSHCGRYVLAFNGEIYNFRELRSRLEVLGHEFRGESDTEVLLQAIATWGVRDAVARSTGMFAFGLWDRSEDALVLCRDRMGEKPLYYAAVNGSFVFASELKALRLFPGWKGEIDRDALTLFLRHSYVPGPRTIYRGVYKLPPASLLRLSGSAPLAEAEPERYWSLHPPPGEDAAPLAGGDAEAVDTLERLLLASVRQQMVADVPVGAFLSGGVDSATIVALMQAVSGTPVRTFTIGVTTPDSDEAPAARRIAEHLRTDHMEQYVSAADALGLIPRLSSIYDEPFADSSQIPTLLVAQLARRSVTVSLSGDGGDELFAGYQRYISGPELVRRLGYIPSWLRRRAGGALLSRPLLRGLDSMSRVDGGLTGERSRRLGEILSHPSPLNVHRALHSSWAQPAAVVRGGAEPATLFTAARGRWSGEGLGPQMLFTDAATYLPDDLLVKVDRAAMSVSLETRVPLLDHRVVEFALRLPWDLKVRGGVSKWILREVLHRYVPRNLLAGPKRGFAVPVGMWLRGPLRDWAGKLLDRDRIEAEGFFVYEPIGRKWEEHLRGSYDWSYPLWTILMFQSWFESRQESPIACTGSLQDT
jgi:asparagine synthase (glutamine-hydrolysing)